MKRALSILRRALTPRRVLLMAWTMWLEYLWLSSVPGHFPASTAFCSIATTVCVVFVGSQIPVIVADIIDGFLQWPRPRKERS